MLATNIYNLNPKSGSTRRTGAGPAAPAAGWGRPPRGGMLAASIYNLNPRNGSERRSGAGPAAAAAGWDRPRPPRGGMLAASIYNLNLETAASGAPEQVQLQLLQGRVALGRAAADAGRQHLLPKP